MTHLEIMPTAVEVDARDLHRAAFTLLTGSDDGDLDEHLRSSVQQVDL